jgi:intein-encoded DNA endonuclease-like protein
VTLIKILTKELLEELYLGKGQSLEDIARQFHCTRPMIQMIMEKHGIARRKRSQARVLAIKHGKFERFKYDDIDESFFRRWTPEMAWVLGLYFTDGYIMERGSGLRVILASIDIELLEKVRFHLKSNRPIVKRVQGYDKTKYLYMFEFFREQMRDDLIGHGLHQKKSLTMQFPEVPDAFKRHFIRGCWDGDGSVFFSGSKLRASYVSGSKTFIETLVAELYKAGIHRRILREGSETLQSLRALRAKYPAHQYPIRIHIESRSKSPSYSIKIDSRDSLMRIYNYFYAGVDESMYLGRKHDVFVCGLGLQTEMTDRD